MKLKSILLTTLVLASTAAWAEPSHRAFVTNEKDNTVSVIDTKTNEVINTINIGERPRGIGLSPDQKQLYVAISEEGAMSDPRNNLSPQSSGGDAGYSPRLWRLSSTE